MTLSSKISALAALAVVAFAPSASAVLVYNNDDLFIGFRQDGNTTKDLAINIGQASIFRDAAGPITLTINAQFAAMMLNAFGASWRTSGDIYWAVVGTPGTGAVGIDSANSLYTSEPVGSIPTSASAAAQGTPRAQIVAFKNDWLAQTEFALNTNASVGNPADSESWANNATSAFEASSLIGPLEDLIANPVDLYRMPPGTNQDNVTKEGQFTINFGNDTIRFVPTPEPSSAALLLLSVGSLVGIQRLRRRA